MHLGNRSMTSGVARVPRFHDRAYPHAASVAPDIAMEVELFRMLPWLFGRHRAPRGRGANRNQCRRVTSSRLTGVALFIASIGVAALVVANKRGIDHLLAASGWFAIPIAIVVFGSLAAAPFTVLDGIGISYGVLFGPFVGALVNAAGLALGAVLGYFLARRTSKLLKIDAEIERLPAWVRRFRVGSSLFLIVLRVVPGVGNTAATQIAASLRVPLWRQVYTMCLVTVPLFTAYAFAGHGVSTYVQQHIVVPAEHFVERHRRERR